MENFKNNFYKFLINKENFYMVQYASKFHNKDNYIAIKNIEGGLYCVLITNEEEENINVGEAIEYLKALNKVFFLNVMVFANENYINSSLYNINKIIINKTNYSVVYNDDVCSPLAQIVSLVATRTKMSPKEIKKKFLEYKIPTLLIIAINIILFIITTHLINNELSNIALAKGVNINQLPDKVVNIVNNSVLISLGAKYSPLIYEGEIWRLITCAFLHGSIMHIACNMYMLYSIGPQIQRIYGGIKYIIIYLISCITSSILSVLINPNSISVGASGGIFGLMGALLAFAIIERHKINKEYTMGLVKTILINLFIGLVVINIDNAAHIGGFLGGGILGYVIYKFSSSKI